jgi:SOS-response transcriptional repressor LexA
MKGLYDPDKRDIRKLEQEREVLEYIQKCFAKYNMAPSYKELARASKSLSSTSTVKATIERLKEKGYIDFHSKIPRSIKILEQKENSVS